MVGAGFYDTLVTKQVSRKDQIVTIATPVELGLWMIDCLGFI